MIEQTNTPKLRFPEFKNEWSYDLLSDVVTNKSKKFDPKKEEATKDIELDSIEQNTGRLLDTYISNDFTSQKNKFKKGNVLYSKLRPYLNKYYYAIIDGVCSSEIWVLNTLNKDVLVNKFLYYFIQTNRFSSVTNKSAGSKMPRADWELVKNIRLYKGSIKEQEKIGYFFSKLDRHIELEEEKLELLEQQKKGYMQKIFSQELRFKDENGNSYPDWSIKKIEDISKVNKGFTPNTKNDKYWDELNENWLSIAGMTQKYLYKGNKGITEKGASKHVKVDKDTLIMSFKLTLGKLAIVKEPIYTNEAICHFVWKESNVNTEYMYYYLNSINISTFGAQAVKGVTLNNDAINSIIVKLPVIQEQNKIAYFFNKLDKLIEKQSSKVELLKQRKQGFLQKMFV
ncbi:MULTISPECIES: restriction endonuclease subunit S [Staphylococcus]|uniref:restriction endonuclease subunit S n=1 Tax=Staphylococcus TaxID=1279 RepID=UPI00094A877E|nr:MULTISPECIES: restriction endonuclease subunit S [Staphylococcus]MBW4835840.1 restriction endonuclease subunit S [Staphylococcaceae bacterium]APT17441.1 restriction endonuclease subunit S [Staphylococcus epidermidis]MBW4843062.1 restriction endonuclease subunit S [Staphylococcaceae bacterium]MCG1059876.1 restriction endonuclease subunit S [Staphylococcus epidermidis]NMK83399.1 restriction endonuclease subunit S [Staphylococcus capitis]